MPEQVRHDELGYLVARLISNALHIYEKKINHEITKPEKHEIINNLCVLCGSSLSGLKQQPPLEPEAYEWSYPGQVFIIVTNSSKR